MNANEYVHATERVINKMDEVLKVNVAYLEHSQKRLEGQAARNFCYGIGLGVLIAAMASMAAYATGFNLGLSEGVERGTVTVQVTQQ